MVTEFNDIVEEIKLRADIVDVISQYIPLKKAGGNFKACCPFHNEKTASFVVSPQKQIFHCFGCHEGGDVFSFVMKHDHLTFPEAIKYLASKLGIHYDEKRFGSKENSTKQLQLKSVYEEAASYYHQQLLTSSGADKARQYLKSRKIYDAPIKEFQLGYASNDSSALLQHLTAKKIPKELLDQSGLFRVDEKRGRRDLFFNRVLFPIANNRGEVIAFGGRVIDDGMPKYLNSPETKIYSKRNELYGLSRAKQVMSSKDRAILVEGYLDVIRLHANGFQEAVAALGTALTDKQVKQIQRYTKNIYVIFDADEAGLKAAIRSLEVILAEGMNVFVLQLPGGKDPDEFLTENSSDALESLLQNADNFFTFKLDRLLERLDKDKPEELSLIAKSMFDVLKKIGDEIQVEKYLQQLSKHLNVSTASLKTEYQKGKTVKRYEVKAEEEKTEEGIDFEKDPEWILIRLLLQSPQLYSECEKLGITEQNFYAPEAREIVPVIKRCYENNELIDFSNLALFGWSEEIKKIITNLVLKELNEEELSHGYFLKRIVEFKRKELNKKKMDLIKKTKEGQLSEKDSLVLSTKIQEINREYSQLKDKIIA